jgi:transcriptional regulator with XRE-family HTH domain
MSNDGSAFGAELRHLRMKAGMSLEALAKTVHYSKGYLSRIETGQKPPNPDLARLCDVALGAGGALARLVTPRGRQKQRADTPSEGPPQPAWIVGAWHLSHDPMALEAFEGLFVHFRKVGSTVSSRLVEGTVIRQARVLMAACLHASGEHRGRLLALAARYAEFAGWMLQESGAEEQSLRWTDAAVHLAEANGDRVMRLHAMVRRALVALHRNDSREVIKLAATASNSPAAPDWLRGLALQREAQGHALAGDYTSAQRALDRAAGLPAAYDNVGAAALRLGPTTVPDQHAMTTGWCLSELGHAGRAAEILDREVARIPVTARRSRARYGIRRALAHALSGEIDHACAIATDVLPDALAIRSATVEVDVTRLSRTVGRWRRHDAVRELLPLLAAVMSATTAATATSYAA